MGAALLAHPNPARQRRTAGAPLRVAQLVHTCAAMNDTKRFGLVGLVLSLACAACGGSVSGGGGGDAGSAAHSGSGGSSPIDCASLVAYEDGTPVEVRFVNNTAGDLYVRHSTSATACFSEAPFGLQDANGQQLTYYESGYCSSACQSYTAVCTVTYTCSDPPVTRIAPQGVYKTGWSGEVLEQRIVPVACLGTNAGSGATATCSARVLPKAYPLSVGATAHTALNCTPPGCTCTPDASGVCTIETIGGLAGDTVLATASYAAGQTSIDLVFQ